MLLFLRILNKLNLLRHINFTISHKINHVRFRLPLQGGVGFSLFFEKEGWMTRILEKLFVLESGKSFVDVGVNLGQTLLIAKSINKEISYFGFEPNSTCNAYLKELIKQNSFSNVQLFPVALGDHDGIEVLYVERNIPDDSNGTLVKNFRETKGRDHEFVPVVSKQALDFLGQARIGIFKIDVEGGELEVVSCLGAIISLQRPFIVCEILPVYSVENEFRLSRQRQLVKLMNEMNYLFYRILADGTLMKVEDIGVHSNLEDCNYLIVPSEKIMQLEHLFQ